MNFPNTVRLIIANFSNIWKILLYYIICAAVLGTILYFCALPLVNALAAKGVFADIGNVLGSILSSSGHTAENIQNIINTTFNVIGENAPRLAFQYTVIVLMLFFIIPFCFGLMELPLGEVLYGYMSSQTKYGFSGSFVKKIGKSCLLQLTKLLVLIPVNVIVITAVYYTLDLITLGSVGLIAAAFLIILTVIVVIALRETFFSLWMPASVVQDKGPFKSLSLAFRSTMRNFGKIFSVALVFVLLAVAVNVFFGLYTLMVALIITIPLTKLAFITFDMCSYFESQGMRYYTNRSTVITPPKMEEQDRIAKIKYLI